MAYSDIDVLNHNIQDLKQSGRIDSNDISDGENTFGELYSLLKKYGHKETTNTGTESNKDL